MTDTVPAAPLLTSADLAVLQALAADTMESFTTDLAELVAIDSGSADRAGVDRAGAWTAGRLASLGFDVRSIPTQPVGAQRFGGVVVGRRRGDGTGTVLLFAHLDTVFSAGTAEARPYREEGSRAFGPGVCDDKAGVAAALHAARTLTAAGRHDYGELIVAFTPDEEVGSPASRDILASLAAEADLALCLECARENGDLVAARKGVADVRIRVTGRAAHSGVEPHRGINAALEAAHLTVELQALSGSRDGLTVNVGRLEAGTRANVVAAEALLTIEVRAERRADLEAVLDAIDARAACPVVTGAAISVARDDVCPPLEPESTGRLLALAENLGAELGVRVSGAATGGASDANFVAAGGTPVLDGVGPIGGGDHSPAEWLDLGSVPERVALLCGLILRGPSAVAPA
ncbi:M20/M25/M40 family metallo-hydrolase [Leifsonia sp. AG29]|uniref:M20/M25/M40 family metallo-hydrolase n=1 Tax=Leifsonia sp. AG29 TaxID=2598860 RepID=UPI001E2E7315|nr:M20/M25/M40 family metallo-hydrolase [Leifsonia sp. AG29]